MKKNAKKYGHIDILQEVAYNVKRISGMQFSACFRAYFRLWLRIWSFKGVYHKFFIISQGGNKNEEKGIEHGTVCINDGGNAGRLRQLKQ